MRRTFITLLALGLISLLHTSARADDKPAKPDPALAAMKKLTPLVGTFDAKGQAYGADGKSTSADAGTVTADFHSLGHVLTIVKSVKRASGETYDDTMVFYFDQTDNKIHATLYALWDNPRNIEVTVEDGKFILLYAPVQGDNGPVVTRETITVNADGSLHWLIEHKNADGSFAKHREIDGVKK
jgi:hypothetical protein